jgi:hypothetical protein
VDCDAATAFDIFVNHLDRWWPVREHSVSGATGHVPLAVQVNPGVGGGIPETMFDGMRTIWGSIQDISPGTKITTRWHPGHNAQKATRLDVTFQDAPMGKCRITLVHSGWNVWGDQAAKRRNLYDGGWDYVVGKCFTERVAELLA